MRVRSLVALAAASAAGLAVGVTGAGPAAANVQQTPGTAAAFSTGQPQAQTGGPSGCGTNIAGEPSIHVS